ncbi:MAG: tRNA pseudouridine(38-40) synthase TruA [Bacteroidales bacterium]|nr:tRNA pseudouridine(38-40) synthase TruA [Bacteroidales bacterium]
MANRYYIFLSYKGTSYHGWQVQPNAISVQNVIEKALSTILNESISVVGAGRTDTGVHASFFCAHFECSDNIITNTNNIVYRLNSILPPDVAVLGIKKVSNDDHARFSAISRTYKYFISQHKSPFGNEFSWYLNKKFNIEKMNETCDILMRHTDFTSFSKLHTDVKTNNCVIKEAYWQQNGSYLVFTIKADRFLRNMVRAIVGTMIEVGLEKISLEEFDNIINAKDRCQAGQSVPAQGLFLVDIEYPNITSEEKESIIKDHLPLL